jgi:hypothetical protein
MGKGGLGGGLIQAVANQGAFSTSPYTSPGLTGGYTPPPTNPYAPQGIGYSSSSQQVNNSPSYS